MSDLEPLHVSSVKSFESETMGGKSSLFFSSDLSRFHCLVLGAAIQRSLSAAACSTILPSVCPLAVVLGTDPCTELLPAVQLWGSSRRKPVDLSDLLMGREAQRLSEKSRNAILSLLFVFVFLPFLPPGVAGRTEPPHISLC